MACLPIDVSGAPKRPVQVFVSHADPDNQVAGRIASFLAEQGVECGGVQQTGDRASPARVTQMIRDSDAFLLLLTGPASRSGRVRREASVAMDAGIRIVVLRLEPVVPDEALGYALTGVVRLDALRDPLEQHLLQARYVLVSGDAAAASTLGPPKQWQEGWHADTDVKGLPRYHDGYAWTRFQRPDEAATTEVILSPPRITEVPGWRFTQQEDGIALWDGQRYTRFVRLPASVRDLPTAELNQALQDEGAGGLSTFWRRARLLGGDEQIREATLPLVATSAALELLWERWGSPLPTVFFDDPEVALGAANKISGADGMCVTFGKTLREGTTSRSRTLLAGDDKDAEAIDRGRASVSTESVTFKGLKMNRQVDFTSLVEWDSNVGRGEFACRSGSDRAPWRVIGMSPEAVALAGVLAASKGALALPALWKDSDGRTALIGAYRDFEKSRRYKRSLKRLDTWTKVYLENLPVRWRPEYAE